MNTNDDDREPSVTSHHDLGGEIVPRANANPITYTYDPQGRLEAVSPPTDQAGDAVLPQTVTAYVYDNGNLASVTVTKRSQ